MGFFFPYKEGYKNSVPFEVTDSKINQKISGIWVVVALHLDMQQWSAHSSIVCIPGVMIWWSSNIVTAYSFLLYSLYLFEAFFLNRAFSLALKIFERIMKENWFHFDRHFIGCMFFLLSLSLSFIGYFWSCEEQQKKYRQKLNASNLLPIFVINFVILFSDMNTHIARLLWIYCVRCSFCASQKYRTIMIITINVFYVFWMVKVFVIVAFTPDLLALFF